MKDKRTIANKLRAKISDEQLIESCKSMTRQEIADEFKMHPETVTRRCRKLGIHGIMCN